MLEILFEIIGELFLEGGLEIAANKKISKWIRYPLALLLILFFTALIGGLIVIGISILDSNIAVGLFLIILGSILMVMGLIQLRRYYIQEINSE